MGILFLLGLIVLLLFIVDRNMVPPTKRCVKVHKWGWKQKEPNGPWYMTCDECGKIPGDD